MRLKSVVVSMAGIAALAAPPGVAAAAPAGATASAATAASAAAGAATAGAASAATTTAGAGSAAVASEWPQFGQSARHLNTNPAEQAFSPGNVAGLRTLFTADFGSNTASEGGPAVAGGVLYQAGFDGNLNAYPASGCGQSSCQPMWRGMAGGDFTSTPAVVGGLVFIASADHFLYAFPAAGCGAAVCAPRWKAHLRAAVVDSSVAVAGGVAYVGDFTGHLYAFTAAGCGAAVCQPRWTGHGLSTELVGAPAVGNGFVYVTTFHNTPDLFNGRLLVFPAAGCGKAICAPSWTAGIGGPAGSTAAPAVTATTVYTTSGTLFGNGTNTRFHLMAFPAAGCGAVTCKPLRTYDTGSGGAEGAPAVSGTMVFATTQGTPDPNTIGVVAAYPAAGCGKPRCEPLWTGVNFESGFASPPSVVNGVVFVGKGPATSVPPDAGLYAFKAAGCGARICMPISFHQLSGNQDYLGAPLAVGEGKVFMSSDDNVSGRSLVYAMGLPGSPGAPAAGAPGPVAGRVSSRPAA